MGYLTAHVKRNPESGEVAVRTHFNEDDGAAFAAAAWLVASPDSGPRSARTDEVDGWDDLYVPTSEDGS